MTDNLPDKANTAPKGLGVEQMIAYRKKGLTLAEIATLTGCTKENVHYHMKRADLDSLDIWREHKADRIEKHQQDLSKSLTIDDHKKMSGLQKIIGIKVQEETIRLMRGQASEIVDHRHLVIDLGKAIDMLRQERSQQGDDDVIDVSDIPACPSK